MKNTNELIKNRFLKLLEKYKIDEIDVHMLCESLNIKRQTFYYHYKNTYDVIYAIYEDKNLEIKDNLSYEDIIKRGIDFLFDNGDFNREVIGSNANEILNEYLFSYIYRSLQKYLKIYDLNLAQKRELARFIGKAITDQIIFKFEDEENTKENIFNNIYALIKEDTILIFVNNYILSFK